MSGRHAIVLAAGAGRRFGGRKLLADWRGRPLILWAVEAALSARIDRVTVVVGSEAEAVAAALTPLAGERLAVVPAAGWIDGLSASLRAGIEALPPEAEAVAIFLGDMPDVSSTEADAVLDAVQAGAPAARLRHPDGPAHPTAFGRGLFSQLALLSGDQGARGILAELGDTVAEIASDRSGAVFDVDTPDDLRRDQA